MTPYALMAMAMGLCPWDDGKNQPRSVPDLPRDDDFYIRKAEEKRSRKAAKKTNQPK